MLLQVPQEVKLCKTRQSCSSLAFSYQYILGFLCKLCVNCISTLIQHICMLSTQYFSSHEVMTSSCFCLERSFLACCFCFLPLNKRGKEIEQNARESFVSTKYLRTRGTAIRAFHSTARRPVRVVRPLPDQPDRFRRPCAQLLARHSLREALHCACVSLI